MRDRAQARLHARHRVVRCAELRCGGVEDRERIAVRELEHAVQQDAGGAIAADRDLRVVDWWGCCKRQGEDVAVCELGLYGGVEQSTTGADTRSARGHFLECDGHSIERTDRTDRTIEWGVRAP